MFLSLLGCLCLTVLSAFVPSPFPDRWPHLWAVLVSAYSCAHFVAFALYLNYVQLFCGQQDWEALSGRRGYVDLRKKRE